jgi:hypothetical protein
LGRRRSISADGKRTGSGFFRKKGGYISVFLVIAVLFLLLAAGNLLKEQMNLKMASRGYERALKFDYLLEGYYLLVRTGYLIPEDGLSYGSTDDYVLEDTFSNRDYIEVLSDSSQVRVRGYYEERFRDEYTVTK